MKEQKPNAYDRGVEDYSKGIHKCPYTPNSKAAERWIASQEDCSMRESMKDGCYEDGDY